MADDEAAGIDFFESRVRPVLVKHCYECHSAESTFDEGPDLVLCYKYLMVLEGHPEYEHSIDPADVLSGSQREYIRTQWKLFKAWWQEWPGASE